MASEFCKRFGLISGQISLLLRIGVKNELRDLDHFAGAMFLVIDS